MDFIRDSAWQFVGVILAIVAIYISIIIYQKQKERKELLYDIISDMSLSSFKISNKIKMSIIFSGKHLTDVSLVYLKIWNNGNKEITPDDFIDPITFNFGINIKVLDIVVESAEPADLQGKVTIQHNSHKIIMNPTLINKGDAIILKILFDKYDGSISASARIKGLKQIKNIAETNLASSGYIKSIGIGAKELFLAPGVRLLASAKLIALIAVILSITFGVFKNLEIVSGYAMIYLSPFALWSTITLFALVGLKKLKVRYHLWVALAISAIIPTALLILTIYATIFAH